MTLKDLEARQRYLNRRIKELERDQNTVFIGMLLVQIAGMAVLYFCQR